MITDINLFKINEAKQIQTSKYINITKLEQYATSLLIICGGEYGDTFYNPPLDKIFICLGDANPFEQDMLKDFIIGYICDDYKSEKNIDVEIDNECGPDPEDDGWLRWDGKKWNTI